MRGDLDSIAFDPTRQDTYFRVRNNVLLSGYGGDEGSGDSIGASKAGYFAWKYRPFFDGVKSCWEYVRVGHKQILFGLRSPGEWHRLDMSRDHLSNTLVLCKLVGDEEAITFMHEVIEKVPWRISLRYQKTPGLHLWMRGLATEDYRLYYLWHIPLALSVTCWNFIWKLILRVPRECSQEEYIEKREEILAIRASRNTQWFKIIVRPFILNFTAWQLFVLPDSPAKKLLSRILRLSVSRHNYLLRLMLGDKKMFEPEWRELIFAYKPMRGGRFSTTFDIQCDRDLRYFHPGELGDTNVLDVDLLIRMYYHQLTRLK